MAGLSLTLRLRAENDSPSMANPHSQPSSKTTSEQIFVSSSGLSMISSIFSEYSKTSTHLAVWEYAKTVQSRTKGQLLHYQMDNSRWCSDLSHGKVAWQKIGHATRLKHDVSPKYEVNRQTRMICGIYPET